MRSIWLLYSGIFALSLGNAQTITTVAGTGIAGYTGDGGLVINAKLNGLDNISFDKIGNYYFVDVIDNVVRRVNSGDTVISVAGTGPGTCNYNGDGVVATSANICPVHVVFDWKNNMIISDQSNHRIREVDSSGIIHTICGTGAAGNSGDGGLATMAEIKCSEGLYIDKNKNIYISDFCNHNIRKIGNNGVITTIAGTGVAGFSGDYGPAVAAQLNGPHSVDMDSLGNLYITDHLNHRIRKIDTGGVITTVAGTGVIGYSGDGGPATSAELYDPAQLVLDNAGNIFFADLYNHAVRKISTNGIISTIAGTGIAGYSGDNGPANAAQLKNAWGVALNTTGDLYISDAGNHVIRKVTNVGVMSIAENKKNTLEAKVYPNPNSGTFKCTMPGMSSKGIVYELRNVYGDLILKKIVKLNGQNEFEISGIEEGVYLLFVNAEGKTKRQKVVVTE